MEFAPTAAKALEKLPVAASKRIFARIDALSLDPRPNGAIRLAGGTGELRVRVGPYRIIYEVNDDVLLVLVLVIGDRKQVYRRRG